MIAVIVPIYNTEKYLRETIDSVICQTLSFAEHIRLILLDDASTDGSMKAYGLRERWVTNLLPF